MIEVKNIIKTFGEKEVLRDVSAKFEQGKVNFIIGRSGSGKSVLTKCIVGLIKPDSGEVLFEGKDFSSMNRQEMQGVRKNIGMLFQGSALFDSLSVLKNVKFPLDMFTQMSEGEKDEKAMACLRKVELEGAEELFPSSLSGGMMKRVGIARAIAMNPRFLFCDEPNSGLDPQTSIVIDNLIQKLTYELNMTTVVISHDMNSIVQIGDQINFLHKGKLEWKGNNAEILKADNEALNKFAFASDLMKKLK